MIKIIFIIEILFRFCLFLEILVVIVFCVDKLNDVMELMLFLEN